MDGQGEAHKRIRPAGPRLKSAALGLLVAAGVLTGAAAPERQTPSGFPVPRYVTLKFDKVNARSGPGDDYQLKWVYRVRGLPVQVIAETAEWRRICDPDGKQVWVHRRTTDGRRAVMNLSARPQPLLRSPKTGAPAAAWLSARSLASLD